MKINIFQIDGEKDKHVCHTPNHRIMLVFGTHSEYFFCQKPHFFKNILVLKQANLPNFVVHSPKPILLIIFEIPSYFPHYLNGFLDILCTNGNFERFLKLRTAFFLFFFRNSKQRIYRRFKKRRNHGQHFDIGIGRTYFPAGNCLRRCPELFSQLFLSEIHSSSV